MDTPDYSALNEQMWTCLVDQDMPGLEAALRAGANPNSEDKQGLAPILLALAMHNVEAVKALASYGAAFPKEAPGYLFDLNFTSSPCSAGHDYTATELALLLGDLDAIKAVLALPGAGKFLLSRSLEVNSSAKDKKYWDEREEHPCLFDRMLNVMLEQVWVGETLTTGERAYAQQALKELVSSFAGEKEVLEVHLSCSTEHVQDRGFGPSLGAPAVHGVSFVIGYSDHSSDELPPKEGWSLATVRLQEESRYFEVGTVALSPNAVARVSHALSSRGDSDFDDVIVQRYFSGTVFISECPDRLSQYVRALGSDADACALFEALHPPDIGCELDILEEWDEQRGEMVQYLAKTPTQLELLRPLIARGADTSLSHFGPLAADVWASKAGQIESLFALLDCDPITQKRLSRSAYYLASPLSALASEMTGVWSRSLPELLTKGLPPEGAHATVVDTLLERGANPNALRQSGPTALCIASRLKDHKTLSSLIAKGADPNQKNLDGTVALIAACEHGFHDNVAILLGAGASANLHDDSGRSPLEVACRRGDEKMVLSLIAAGADVQYLLERIKRTEAKVSDEMRAVLHASSAKSVIEGVLSRTRGRALMRCCTGL